MYRTHGTSTSGHYITELINNPQHDFWEFVPYKLRIKEVSCEEDGTLELSLQNGDSLFPYILSGISEIKSFLGDMQVLRAENDTWKGIPKLQGMTLYGIFHQESGDFYALGIPVRRSNLCPIGELTMQRRNHPPRRLKDQIKENEKETKEKKDAGELTEPDYSSANELRKEGLIDEKNKLTEQAKSLAQDSIDINDLYDNSSGNDESL